MWHTWCRLMQAKDLTLAQKISGPQTGYKLGAKDTAGNYYIFNHLAFNVLIHKTHGEYTRAQQNSPYTSGLVMDAATRKLLGSRGSEGRTLLHERDEHAGRTLIWPEGTPGTVVDALRSQSSRSVAQAKESGDDKPQSDASSTDSDDRVR
jgi:hypothetical protein